MSDVSRCCRLWLPIAVGLAALSATLILRHALKAREQAEIARAVQTHAAAVRDEILPQFDSRIRMLARMAKRWGIYGQPAREAWEADARSIVEDYPDLQGIAWVGPDMVIRWVAFTGETNIASMIGTNLAGEEQRRQALLTSRDQRKAHLSRTVRLKLDGDPGIIASIPVFHQDRFDGYIVTGIRINEFLDPLFRKESSAGYAIALSEGSEMIYERPSGPHPADAKWAASLPLEIHGLNWQARVRPLAPLLAARHSHISRVILGLGMSASVLLGVSVYLAQSARRKSRRMTANNLALKREMAERRQAEVALMETSSLLETLLKNTTDCIYFKDLDSRFMNFSQSMLDFFNLSDPAELKGRTDFDFFTEHHARAAFEDEQEIIRSGRPLIGKVENEVLMCGKETWALTSKMPFRDTDGRIIGTFGLSKDITGMKVKEAELAAAHRQLLETSHRAGMSEVATSVLHNVGNVLNSVNISCGIVADRVRKSRVGSVAKTAALLHAHADDLGTFVTMDPAGKRLPEFLDKVANQLASEQSGVLSELQLLGSNIDHIKDIVAMQQNYAKVSGITESVRITDLVEDSLRMNEGSLARHTVRVIREYDEVPPITLEKHKALQILVNLIRNAKHACEESGREDKQLTLRVAAGSGSVRVSVIDNGVGITPDNLTRIFAHGFTTKVEGHGFGLHSGALAATDMGGSLSVQSAGAGTGATFTLELPLECVPSLT